MPGGGNARYGPGGCGRSLYKSPITYCSIVLPSLDPLGRRDMRVSSFSSCIHVRKKTPGIWMDGKFPHQKLSVVKAHSVHILHCVDVCGLIRGSGSVDHAGSHRAGIPTKSLRLKGGPAWHAFSTS